MTKVPDKSKAAPELSPLICNQIAALEYDLPEYRILSNGEVGALGVEALEGYVYGERLRYDTAGKRWDFKRNVVENGFYLTITVSVSGIVLGEASVALDRIAGKEGEEQLLAVVDRLAADTVDVARACRAQQKALQTEAAAQAELPPVEAEFVADDA